MNPFVVRTALPFGYLFAYVLLVGGVVFGFALLATGLRRRRKGRAASGVIALAFLIYVLVANVEEDGALDMSHVVRDATEVTGRWNGSEGTTLTLSADGNYRCVGYGECLRVTNTGTWHLLTGSPEIELHPFGSAVPDVAYTVVTYRGHMRLAHHIEDPDTWDGEMPFELVTPAV